MSVQPKCVFSTSQKWPAVQPKCVTSVSQTSVFYFNSQSFPKKNVLINVHMRTGVGKNAQRPGRCQQNELLVNFKGPNEPGTRGKLKPGGQSTLSETF